MPLVFTNAPVLDTEALETNVAPNTNSLCVILSGALYYFTNANIGGSGFPTNFGGCTINKSLDGVTFSTFKFDPAALQQLIGAVAAMNDGIKAWVSGFNIGTGKAILMPWDSASDTFGTSSADGPAGSFIQCLAVNSDDSVLVIYQDFSTDDISGVIYTPGTDSWGVPVLLVSGNGGLFLPFSVSLVKQKLTDRSYFTYVKQTGVSSWTLNVRTITAPLTLGTEQDLSGLVGAWNGDGVYAQGLPCIFGADSEIIIPIAVPSDRAAASTNVLNVLRATCATDPSFSLQFVDQSADFTPPEILSSWVGEAVFIVSAFEYQGDLYLFYPGVSTNVASDPTDGKLFYAVQTGGAGAWSVQNQIYDSNPLGIAQVYPVLISPTSMGLFAVIIDPTTFFDDFDPELKFGSLQPQFLLTGTGFPLDITCGSPPDGTVGVPYSHFFPASGGIAPYTFSVTAGALPDGLSLDPGTGEVSGTPTLAGVFPFTVQVTDSDPLAPNIASVDCSITIEGGAGPPVASCNNPPNGLVGTAYNHTFGASGGTPPYTFSISAGFLPPGLSMDAAGVVSGFPTTAGLYAFTVLVTDSLGATGSVDCSILILLSLRITLRGVKLFRVEESCDNPEVVRELPSVDRAV